MHTVEQEVSEIVADKLADSVEVFMICLITERNRTAESLFNELDLTHVLFRWHMLGPLHMSPVTGLARLPGRIL